MKTNINVNVCETPTNKSSDLWVHYVYGIMSGWIEYSGTKEATAEEKATIMADKLTEEKIIAKRDPLITITEIEYLTIAVISAYDDADVTLMWWE